MPDPPIYGYLDDTSSCIDSCSGACETGARCKRIDRSTQDKRAQHAQRAPDEANFDAEITSCYTIDTLVTSVLSESIASLSGLMIG